MMVRRRLLKVGDLIRLKVHTISGWKGIGVICEDQVSSYDGPYFIRRDSSVWMDGDCYIAPSMACPHEVALMRDQGTVEEQADRVAWCRMLTDRRCGIYGS
jgi:hypothetical protein